ncbi:hypothetical protein BC832DRAFT_595867 [Gaertneriomyces semiglobifer]|nr:hypothetical protein BC832DRAFT_595867 [Gaertneriomyces semiglobifer]
MAAPSITLESLSDVTASLIPNLLTALSIRSPRQNVLSRQLLEFLAPMERWTAPVYSPTPSDVHKLRLILRVDLQKREVVRAGFLLIGWMRWVEMWQDIVTYISKSEDIAGEALRCMCELSSAMKVEEVIRELEIDEGRVSVVDLGVSILQADTGVVERAWMVGFLRNLVENEEAVEVLLEIAVQPLIRYMKDCGKEAESWMWKWGAELCLGMVGEEEGKRSLTQGGVVGWLLRRLKWCKEDDEKGLLLVSYGVGSQPNNEILLFTHLYKVLRTLTNVLPTPCPPLPALNKLVPRIVRLANKPSLTLAAFALLRNILALFPKSHKKFLLSPGVDMVVNLVSANTDEKLLEHSLACLRSIVLGSEELLRRIARLPLHTYIDPQVYNEEILHQALCLLINVATDDLCAQYLTSHPSEPSNSLLLKLHLLLFSETSSDSLKHDSLCLLRNLCIDEPSCLLILSLNQPLLIDYLLNFSQFQVPALSILRNLLTTTPYAFHTLFTVDGFLEEVIAGIASPSPCCQYSVDIIRHYATYGSDLHRKAIVDADGIRALVGFLASGVKNKQAGVEAFKKLRDYERGEIGFEDCWEKIAEEWRREDSERKDERRDSLRDNALRSIDPPKKPAEKKSRVRHIKPSGKKSSKKRKRVAASSNIQLTDHDQPLLRPTKSRPPLKSILKAHNAQSSLSTYLNIQISRPSSSSMIFESWTPVRRSVTFR